MPTPTRTPDFVPSPLEEVVPSSPTHTAEPNIDPTITAEIQIPPTITEEPPLLEETNPAFPVGFVTASGDYSTVTFYDLSGMPLGTAQTPGMSSGPATYLHIAGGFAGNPQEVPVVYLSYENTGEIRQALNGQVTTLVPGGNVSYLCGAPGQNALVYSTVTWGGEALNSHFYVRSAYGGGASWIWERVDPESWAIAPLAAQAENHELHTIFYTLEPYGIGGDIVFPPRKGLFQLNLENAENILHLTEDFNPIGLSPDNTYVAYTEVNNNLGAQTDARITLYNLASSLMASVDLAPGSDRGGGYAVFSPDNMYVAWMEGSGWMMAETPTFHTRVRMADINGRVTADLPDDSFAAAASDPTVRWAVPVGWLDGENLLVEVHGDNWHEPALVAVRYDGSDLRYLVSGKFSGFLYP